MEQGADPAGPVQTGAYEDVDVSSAKLKEGKKRKVGVDARGVDTGDQEDNYGEAGSEYGNDEQELALKRKPITRGKQNFDLTLDRGASNAPGRGAGGAPSAQGTQIPKTIASLKALRENYERELLLLKEELIHRKAEVDKASLDGRIEAALAKLNDILTKKEEKKALLAKKKDIQCLWLPIKEIDETIQNLPKFVLDDPTNDILKNVYSNWDQVFAALQDVIADSISKLESGSVFPSVRELNGIFMQYKDKTSTNPFLEVDKKLQTKVLDLLTAVARENCINQIALLQANDLKIAYTTKTETAQSIKKKQTAFSAAVSNSYKKADTVGEKRDSLATTVDTLFKTDADKVTVFCNDFFKDMSSEVYENFDDVYKNSISINQKIENYVEEAEGALELQTELKDLLAKMFAHFNDLGIQFDTNVNSFSIDDNVAYHQLADFAIQISEFEEKEKKYASELKKYEVAKKRFDDKAKADEATKKKTDEACKSRINDISGLYGKMLDIYEKTVVFYPIFPEDVTFKDKQIERFGAIKEKLHQVSAISGTFKTVIAQDNVWSSENQRTLNRWAAQIGVDDGEHLTPDFLEDVLNIFKDANDEIIKAKKANDALNAERNKAFGKIKDDVFQVVSEAPELNEPKPGLIVTDDEDVKNKINQLVQTYANQTDMEYSSGLFEWYCTSRKLGMKGIKELAGTETKEGKLKKDKNQMKKLIKEYNEQLPASVEAYYASMQEVKNELVKLRAKSTLTEFKKRLTENIREIENLFNGKYSIDEIESEEKKYTQKKGGLLKSYQKTAKANEDTQKLDTEKKEKKATSKDGGADSTDFSTQLKLLPLSLFSGFRPTFYAAPLRFVDERTRSSQLVLKKLFFPTTTALKVFAPVLSFAGKIAESKPLVLKKLFFPTTTALKVFAPVLSFTETIAEQKPLVLKKLFFPTTTALKVFAPVLSFTKTIAEQKPLVLKKLFFPTTTALKVFAPKLSFVKARRKLALKKLFFPTSVSLKVFAPRLTKGHLEDIIKTNKRIDEKWRDSIFTDAMINRDSSDRMRSLRVQTVDEPGDDLMNLKMNYNGKREEFEFFNVFDNPKIYKVNVGLPDIAPPRRILRSLPVLNVGA